MAWIERPLFHRIFGPGTHRQLESAPYQSPADRDVLVSLVRWRQPEVVVEVGAQAGYTAALLLRECPSIRQYVGIDLPPGALPDLAQQHPEVPPVPGQAALGDPRYRVVLSDSATLSPVDLPEADMVLIDGGHDEAHVASDTELARRILRPGGVCAWHDYANDHPDIAGVRRALDRINAAEGDHIVLVGESWTCFSLRLAPCGPRPPRAVIVDTRPSGRDIEAALAAGHVEVTGQNAGVV